MESNQWYEVPADPESEARWDKYSAFPELPSVGAHPGFDAFLKDKNLTRDALVRIGARWTVLEGEPALAYLFPDGLKYRGVLTGKKRTESGVNWTRSKIIPARVTPGTNLIIAEGETDGAFLTHLCGDTHDVAILPAGAKLPLLPADNFGSYQDILVGLDNDAPGDEGAARLLDRYSQSRRLRPPDDTVDWCEAAPVLFDPEAWVEDRPRTTWSVGTFVEIDFGTAADNNWFENGIVPKHGMVAVHGPMKSLKSFIILEFARAIATGTSFAGYVPFVGDKPGRVLLVQYEVSAYEFQKRLLGLLLQMPQNERRLFRDNVYVYGLGDGVRPRIKATEAGLYDRLRRILTETQADVVVFDPVQRMTGTGNLDKTHEIEPLLDAFARLGDTNTVIFAHHNNKASRNAASPYGMAGSQRFGADVDSILSVYEDSDLPQDSDSEKHRMMAWELRNGACGPRVVSVKRDGDHVRLAFADRRENPVPENRQLLDQPPID